MLLGTRLECIESSPRVSEAGGSPEAYRRRSGASKMMQGSSPKEDQDSSEDCWGMMDFSELSINVLLLRWSKANQELSLELSPRRDSVITREIQSIGWMAGGEEEAAAGGHGKDSDGRQEEEAAAGGRGEDSDCRREEAVGASAFGAATAAEVGDSGREAREEGSAGG
ncbi:hypothetical protein BHM03_00041332 [Ensete ventricosum]|nr:hypothetical protein BHM03_00041332 [Ensete ventricosum]